MSNQVIGVYIRVSNGDRNQMELEMQRNECIQTAHELFAKDIVLKCYVDEGVGTKENSELKQMMNDVRHGDLDVVITHKVNRMSRFLSQSSNMIREIHNSDARFISVTEGEYCTPHSTILYED